MKKLIVLFLTLYSNMIFAERTSPILSKDQASNILMQNNNTHSSLKIGVININYVLENAPQSQRIKEQLSQEFNQKEKQLNDYKHQINTLQIELDSIQSRDENAQQKSNDLIYKINKLERDRDKLAEDFRQDYSLRVNEELLKIQKEIFNEIIRFAEEEHFDFIFESDVFYVNPKFIITEKILSRLK